jgi:hypothetical protein
MTVELIAGGIVQVDIADLLPLHRLPGRRYPKRSARIRRQFFHKSGVLGADGFEGCYNSARYCTTRRRFPNSDVPGWAGMPYTFWSCFDQYTLHDADDDGLVDHDDEPNLHGDELVYFRCNADDLRTWHTGAAANNYGVGYCNQGSGQLSEYQQEIMEAHIPWAHAWYDLAWPAGLSWHSDRSVYGPPRVKPVCPGRGAVAWLSMYRGDEGAI